ncbi:recombinase family protein, partial [Viridibacillus sp. YIM B01967]
MGYADLKVLSNAAIGVYCRVSTSGQNIGQQEQLAEGYFSKNQINTNNVQYFLDDNISANKLAFEKRPELNRLISEIQKGKIKTVLVQNRDRLARNFYEYIDLVKIFYKYDVYVIFTDSGHPSFSKSLSVESLYGIFAQSEGRNIADRTSLVALQYPNSLMGFNVIGKGDKKNYTPKLEMERDIKSLFYSVGNVNSAEELIEQLMRFKKVTTNNLKLLACLKNPFYAGHMKLQEQYVRLPHVEPIILLDDYLKVQECLLKFEQEIQDSIANSNGRGVLQPICSSCKTVMTFRSNNIGAHGYYVCVKNHSRIFIEASRYN